MQGHHEMTTVMMIRFYPAGERVRRQSTTVQPMMRAFAFSCQRLIRFCFLMSETDQVHDNHDDDCDDYYNNGDNNYDDNDDDYDGCSNDLYIEVANEDTHRIMNC